MEHALRVLEYDSIRELLVGQCETPLGASLAEALKPAWKAEAVWQSLDRTDEAYRLLATDPPPSLGAVHDVRQSLIRASKGGALGGEELYRIGSAISAMRSVRQFIRPKGADIPYIWGLCEVFPEDRKLEDRLLMSLESDGTVKDEASANLGTLRKKIRSTNSRIIERIQSYTTGKTRDLLSDPIYTVRDGRYVIPLKAENRGKIRGIVHDSSATGHTVYLEPEDVLQLGNAQREAEAAERQEVLRILADLSTQVGAVAPQILVGVEATGELDLLLAKGRLGFALKGCKPLRAEGHVLILEAGRHPLIEPDKVVPTDLSVGTEFQGLLITGPNTGGKTIAMKCAGLAVLMAQSGLMPAARSVRLGPFSQIWADIGDEQSLQQSLSTFSAHIKNIAEALKGLHPGALVLLDEVGAGTDPAEGAALARALLTALRDGGACIIASTHYGELKAFAYNTPGFLNAAMEFDSKSLRPTYRLLLGAPGASHALKIAERCGIPKDIVDQAKEGLGEQQQDVALMLERLETSQKQARIAQGEADRRMAELRKLEEVAQRKLKEADEIRKNVHAKANESIESTLREIRLEAAKIFDEIKQGKATDEGRRKLKDLQEVGASVAAEFKITPKGQATGAQLKKGMSVRVEGYSQVGTLLEDPAGRQVQVQMGPLKLKLDVSLLAPVAAEKAKSKASSIGLQKAQTATTEIHLRHMRAEDAEEELDRFLDEAVLAGLHQVRIVHGKGEGVLRQVTRTMLKKHRDVKTFRDGDATEGGQGVTIAIFR